MIFKSTAYTEKTNLWPTHNCTASCGTLSLQPIFNLHSNHRGHKLNRKLQLADRAKGARLGAANELMRAKTSSRRFERYLSSIRSDEGLTLAASALLSFFILMALINSFDTKTGSRAGTVARAVSPHTNVTQG